MLLLFEWQRVGERGGTGGSQTEDNHTMNTWTGDVRFALLACVDVLDASLFTARACSLCGVAVNARSELRCVHRLHEKN
jgi:hypothetical protein